MQLFSSSNHQELLESQRKNKRGDLKTLENCADKHIKTYDYNCISAICSKGCLHGTCIAPDECICNQGWSGESCDECIQLPGCNHGYCNNTANACICHQGWRGRLCDEPICLPGCNLDHAKCSKVITVQMLTKLAAFYSIYV